MPNRWAVANGNWSSTATWNSGGSLGIPTGSDDVFANTFTVNVDTSFEVLTLRNTSAAGVSAGGTFNFNTGNILASITSATGLVSTTSNFATITATSGTVTISAPNTIIVGSPAIGQLINHTGACNFTITASSFIGGSNNPTYAINKSSNGLLTVVGAVNSTVAAATTSTILVSAGSAVVIGNINGSTSGVASGQGVSVSSAATLTVIGNIVGGSIDFGLGQSNVGVSFTGASLIVTGSITGGTGSPAISISSTGTINVSGSVNGGTVAAISSATANTTVITGSVNASTSAAGISYTGASLISVSGSCSAGSNSPAVVSTNASATNIFTGPFINTNNTMAVQCVRMLLTQDASTFWNFGNATLFSPERLAFYPSASDIRQGVTYADGTVSGSLAMPPPSAVIAGTPTDNTTGSAILTPEQLQDAFWGAPLSQMTDTGSIGARLAKSATLDSTGNQLASYLI